jgi:hypothetical protein
MHLPGKHVGCFLGKEDFTLPHCKGTAIDDGRHLKSRQWITLEMMLLTKVQIHYLHLNYIYYIRLVCALL